MEPADIPVKQAPYTARYFLKSLVKIYICVHPLEIDHNTDDVVKRPYL